VTPYMIACIGH